MLRLIELVKCVQQAMHVTKPLLFELVLFVWAVVELVRFMISVAFGGAA
jgi:hypothetical protein